MQYLEVLHAALQDMAHAYQPAERMAHVLNAVMIELRGGVAISPGKSISLTSSNIPARRGSEALDTERPTMKRRQTSRSRKSRAMLPPQTTVRQHRASDSSADYAAIAQQSQHHNDYVLVTPRTEGTGWPDIHGLEGFQDQTLMPTPDFTNILSPGRRNDWFNGSFGSNDFPTMPSMIGLPGTSDSDTLPEFLTLPNEDDWNRWHNGPEVTHDLDGMQFARYS